MKWFFGLIIVTSIFMSIQTLRADEDIQGFAKLICHGSKSGETAELLHGFFLEVDTLQEIQEKYPERFNHILKLCDRKRGAINGFDLSASLWSVESVAVSDRAPRTWQQPCVEHAQCESASCNLRLGKCNPRFKVPFSAAN